MSPVLKLTFCRVKFSEEQVKNTQSRLDRLEGTAKSQTTQLEKLHSNRTAIAAELKELERAVQASQESLASLNAILEERNKMLDSAKRAAIKASKENEKAQKDIAAMVAIFF
jgi:structural maintenance of chromosome 1